MSPKRAHRCQNFEKSLTNQTPNINIIDTKTFIDYILINELMRNFDGYRASLYFYKFKNKNKLYLGPIWDFNLSSGDSYIDKYNSIDDFVFEMDREYSKFIPMWWYYLISDKKFSKKIKTQWKKSRKNEFSNKNIEKLIDDLNNQIEDYENKKQTEILKTWLINRAEWLDENIEKINSVAKEYLN